MAVFAKDMAVAFAAALDINNTAAPLAAAIQLLFYQAFADQNEPVTAITTPDGAVLVENEGYDDGAAFVRDGAQWRIKPAACGPFARPAPVAEQHLAAAWRVVRSQWWGNDGEHAFIANMMLGSAVAEPGPI